MDKVLARSLLYTIQAAIFGAEALEHFCRRSYESTDEDSWANQAHRIHQLLIETERRATVLLQEIE